MIKILKQLTASLMIGLGAILILSGVYALVNPDISQEEKTAEATACLLFGLPLTGGGVWILRGLGKHSKEETETRLQSVFYHLLQQNHGQITVIQFAMETKLPAKEAETYLNAKAQEFNATFNARDDGEISYQFPM